MLEAQAHLRLKQLLKQGGGSSWPHHLTLTRLVARSLRRGDHSLFPVSATVDRPWLLGLLLQLLQRVCIDTAPLHSLKSWYICSNAWGMRIFVSL